MKFSFLVAPDATTALNHLGGSDMSLLLSNLPTLPMKNSTIPIDSKNFVIITAFKNGGFHHDVKNV